MNPQMLCDVTVQPLYDTVRLYPGKTESLFVIPVGAGETCFGEGPKHWGDTNMFIGSQMPAGYEFKLRTIYVEPLAGVHPGDEPAPWAVSLAGTALELIIGCKRFLTIPVSRARAVVNVSSGTVALVHDVARMLRDVHPTAHPLALSMMPGFVLGFDLSERAFVFRSSENFAVQLRSPRGPVSTLPITLRVYLNGIMYRPVQ